MNAIWSGSHLHVKGGISGRKSSMPSTYDTTSHDSISCRSPPLIHHHHKQEQSLNVKSFPTHSSTCASNFASA